jgi:hypothetical protein
VTVLPTRRRCRPHSRRPQKILERTAVTRGADPSRPGVIRSLPGSEESGSEGSPWERGLMENGDGVSSLPANEPDRDRVAAAPAVAIFPQAASLRADTAGTSAPADTSMVGDPEQLHEQWAAIQSTFVDDPRGSVVAGAELISETIAALVASAKERERGLRDEWDRDGVDTEGLRNVLRSYRGLLDRLVRV